MKIEECFLDLWAEYCQNKGMSFEQYKTGIDLWNDDKDYIEQNGMKCLADKVWNKSY